MSKRDWSEHHKGVSDDFIKRVNESEHPEMQNIPPDHEFMVVRFRAPSDELNQKLQDRIDKLKEELSDDEEDEDDGGDSIVRV
jgi:metal-dependent amidase/aminoacylase/carboxypeptidase family protein